MHLDGRSFYKAVSIRDNADQMMELSQAAGRGSTAQPTPEFFVFVVDDDAAVRRALELALVHEGYRVSTYDSAEAFLETFQSESYGCLVLDVCMPGIEGLELQEQLTKLGADLPIIFVTGNASVPQSVLAIKRGAVDFLEKPFRRQILLDRIREARDSLDSLRHRRSLQRRLRDSLAALTRREREVFDLLVSEQPRVSSKELAAVLDISPRTAEQHRASVLDKFGVDSIAALGILLARADFDLDDL
ncbi:MAG: response regulator [Pseudomonadota bacterium]